MATQYHSIRVSGYTLLETLIALFVLTTALLGFAALSTQALQATRGAIHHDLATLQAHDLVERIRANPAGVSAGIYLSLSGTPSGSDCSATECNPEQMARFDLREWNQRNAILLPSGSGTVERQGDTYQITLHWQSGPNPSSYTLPFVPP